MAKIKPKRQNTNGNVYHRALCREERHIRAIDRDRKKPEPADRNIMEYPQDVNTDGRVWSF